VKYKVIATDIMTWSNPLTRRTMLTVSALIAKSADDSGPVTKTRR